MRDSQAHEDPVLDPSKKAGAVLDYVLNVNEEEVIAQEKVQESVHAELKKQPVIVASSNRTNMRVLFITTDVGILKEGSLAQRHFKNIANTFNEVHVMVLCEYWQARKDVVRLQKNMWVYTTAARHSLLQIFTAHNIARLQLSFVDGFRPDIVVALDPYVSGACGISIATHYKRVFQVHVTEDFLLPEFKTKEKGNAHKIATAKKVLKKAKSIRVSTQTLKEKLQKHYPKTTDLSLLPRHYDVDAIIKATEEKTTEIEVAQLLPNVAFVALFVGELDKDSTLFRALDASRTILQSSKIALVVIGDGPYKKEFQERARILGIAEQVIFLPGTTKLIPYLQRADILLCTDTTEISEELVIKAAAAGLPLLLAKTPLRSDLFENDTSAFLCDKEDTIDFGIKLRKFLNGPALRVQFSESAKEVVKIRLHEDPEAFKEAYRNSVEGAFTTDPLRGISFW